ncbi:hypothetical protein RCO48_17165 [Peribacillus frigoritolerans]|nr:hypothetical protein [Peribacillus frigoritolerans]
MQAVWRLKIFFDYSMIIGVGLAMLSLLAAGFSLGKRKSKSNSYENTYWFSINSYNRYDNWNFKLLFNLTLAKIGAALE